MKPLNGLEFIPLADGETPVDAIVLIKYLDPEGSMGWALRRTSGLPDVEVIGALTVMGHHQLTEFEGSWVADEDDGGGP